MNANIRSAHTEASPYENTLSTRFSRIVHLALVTPPRLLRIPAVHVVRGGDDAVLVGMARCMEELCPSPRLTRSLTHGGGHDVPRSPKDAQMLWSAVDWAVNGAQRQMW